MSSEFCAITGKFKRAPAEQTRRIYEMSKKTSFVLEVRLRPIRFENDGLAGLTVEMNLDRIEISP